MVEYTLVDWLSYLFFLASGYPGYRTAGVASVSMSQSVKVDQTSYSTPILGSRPPRKRKNYKDLQNINQAPKKYCGAVTNNPLYIQGGLVGLINVW